MFLEGRVGFSLQKNRFYYLMGDSNALRRHRIFSTRVWSPAGSLSIPTKQRCPQSHCQCHTAPSGISSLPFPNPLPSQRAPTAVRCLARAPARPRHSCKTKLVKKQKQNSPYTIWDADFQPKQITGSKRGWAGHEGEKEAKLWNRWIPLNPRSAASAAREGLPRQFQKRHITLVLPCLTRGKPTARSSFFLFLLVMPQNCHESSERSQSKRSWGAPRSQQRPVFKHLRSQTWSQADTALCPMPSFKIQAQQRLWPGSPAEH